MTLQNLGVLAADGGVIQDDVTLGVTSHDRILLHHRVSRGRGVTTKNLKHRHEAGHLLESM
jgi:hypothetical protein